MSIVFVYLFRMDIVVKLCVNFLLVLVYLPPYTIIKRFTKTLLTVLLNVLFSALADPY